jgi:hypothetical protein
MHLSSALLTASAAAAIGLAIAGPARALGPTIGPLPVAVEVPEVCFAPDADDELVDAYARVLGASRARGSADLSVAASQYQDGYRWSRTATNGFGLAQGDPTTITWSIVPDGTPITGAIGEPAAPSNLRAFLNAIYGNESVWLPIFQSVFDRWADLTGTSYVYEPADDFAQIGSSSLAGALGVRADVRIGGHTIDGNSGVLAYNYYPNNGDMVIDTADSFYGNTNGGSLRLRNTLAHEHGHGLGLPHVCPVNQSKLMEPFLTTAFDGPQHDDILGVNRGYGDDLEHNDAIGSSSDLGALSNGSVHVDGISVDDDGDHDFFRFRVGANKKATVTVSPVGFSYLQGPQQSNGSCTAGTSYDSRALNDLAVQVLDVDGTTVLGQADASPAGQPESLANVVLPGGNATYYARVVGGPNSVAQLYDFSLAIDDVTSPPDDVFADGFEPDISRWSASATGGGDLFTASGVAALGGTFGLVAWVDDQAPLWVEDASPDAEARYRARFWFDPNGFAPATAKKPVQIFRAVSDHPSTKKLMILLLRKKNEQYQLRLRVARPGGMTRTPWIAISDAPQAIELDWKKSSAMGAADGHAQMWVDGTSVAWLGGLDNAARFLDTVRLGVWQLRPASGGTLYFDDFVSRRATYIGP